MMDERTAVVEGLLSSNSMCCVFDFDFLPFVWNVPFFVKHLCHFLSYVIVCLFFFLLDFFLLVRLFASLLALFCLYAG